MKFGLAFQASQSNAHYSKCLNLLNRYGFDMFQVYDDLLFRPAWSVLDYIAPRVRDSKTNLTIGPGVTNPFHYHPAIIAAFISDLDQQTKGKTFLMIGRGAFHDLVGLKIENPIRSLREAIIIIYNLIHGRKMNFNGKRFSVTAEAQFRWTPPGDWDSNSNSGAKRIPIWIGTWGPRTCQLAGSMKEVAGVMVSSIIEPRYIVSLRENLAIGAKRASREVDSIELGLVSGTVVSKDRDTAFKLARESVAPYLPYLSPMTEFVGIDKAEIDGIREALAKGDLKLATSLVSEKSVNAFKPWGTPDDIIERVSRLMNTGLTRINFGFGRGPEDLEGIELLGKHVLPYFANK
ncbi:MAG: LLM class flavin-dependent oxidoreductase [Thaumarchaeota archaeon]|nr:LLM class flavin-dependent oxidoreductase [Nitrososphaerota archaeon]